MNAQIEGVTQLSLCHIGHRWLLSDSLFPFVKEKLFPSWLRHTTTPCAHPKSISVPAKGFILSCCFMGTFEFPLDTDPDPNLPMGWGLQCRDGTNRSQTSTESSAKAHFMAASLFYALLQHQCEHTQGGATSPLESTNP